MFLLSTRSIVLSMIPLTRPFWNYPSLVDALRVATAWSEASLGEATGVKLAR
jgi:hypothetical protein